MSLARIAPVTEETIALSKIVPLHDVLAQEEQVKSTDQGNITARKRKNLMPASDQVKVPSNDPTALQQEIMRQLEALSSEEKAAVLAKLRTSVSTIMEELPKLANATKGTGSNEEPAFNAWDSSILMLYTHFAEEQMNQNGMIMNGWQAQQQAQNQVLQETAQAEGANAKKKLDSTKASWWKCLLIALAVVAAVVITAVVTVATAGIALPALGTAAIAIGAAAIGGGAFAAAYCPTNADPTSSASSPLTTTGPDETLIQEVSNANIFYNTISQKTNNAISTGSQTNLVNASSNDTQLGQQASQIIQAMGRTMNVKTQ